MIIRSATKVDLPRIALLSKQLGYPLKLAKLESNFMQLGPQHHIFVVEHQQKVVAWSQVTQNLDLSSGPYLQVDALIVDSQYRSQGIGGQIFNHIKTLSDQHGIPLRIHSQIKRKRAHQFYQRRLASLTKTQHLFIYTPPSCNH